MGGGYCDQVGWTSTSYEICYQYPGVLIILLESPGKVFPLENISLSASVINGLYLLSFKTREVFM